ncbi:MAG: hypothetical protein R3350_05660, partial [Saprospiraceae bacterium]|nr:hypothetical protein [Saprospiraceae bacterium]
MSRIIAFFLPLLFLLPPWQSEAQRTIKLGENYYEEDEGIIYTKEFTIDLKLHTHGFSLGVNSGNLETFYLTNYFHIELGEIKHPKEFRQSFDFQPPNTGKIARSFIFGKQNNFFVLRGGLGQKRYLSEKAKRKGLAIGLSYEGGPALGLLKPYYLELKFFSEPGFGDFEIRSEKLTEETEEFFLDVNRIFGASPFSKGLGEIKVRPGLH